MEHITDLGFLENNLEFPPKVCEERLAKYKYFTDCYTGDYAKGRKLVIRTATGKTTKDINIAKFNFYKLVVDKMKSIILSELPSVTVDTQENTNILLDMISNTNFWGVLGDVVWSECTLGDGVFFMDASGGEFSINAVSPNMWIPVVSNFYINNTVCNVLYQFIFEPNYSAIATEDKITHLRVLFCYKGKYIERYYSFDGSRIGGAVEYKGTPAEGREVKTNLKGNSVLSVHNSRTVNRVYGVSDLEAIDSSVQKYEHTNCLFELITDKHSDPIFQTSKDTVKKNEKTGEKDIDTVFGNIIFPKPGGVDSKYITWDGNLTQLMEYMDKQLKNIGILSEFGENFFTGTFGANASGESIRSMGQSILAKASRLIDTLDFTVKQIFCEMLYTKGIEVNPSDITITWQDGLPDESNYSKAQAVQLRKSSGTMSTYRVLTEIDGLTDEQALAEIERIKAEQKGEVVEDVGKNKGFFNFKR